MPARKKNEEPEQNTEEKKENDVEDPTAEKRAEMGDMRVPSQPLQPADIPPAPLTPTRTSSNA